MADSVWWSLVDGVLADNPDLQATTRSVLSLLIEVDAELDKRGAPYPQTLAYLVRCVRCMMSHCVRRSRAPAIAASRP